MVNKSIEEMLELSLLKEKIAAEEIEIEEKYIIEEEMLDNMIFSECYYNGLENEN